MESFAETIAFTSNSSCQEEKEMQLEIVPCDQLQVSMAALTVRQNTRVEGIIDFAHGEIFTVLLSEKSI